jgi:hypothetical protein
MLLDVNVYVNTSAFFLQRIDHLDSEIKADLAFIRENFEDSITYKVSVHFIQS